MDEIEYVTVPARTAKAVDFLNKLSKKRSDSGRVDSDRDWKIMVELYKVWRDLYPEDYYWFRKSVMNFKSMHLDNKGFGKEGTGLIQHQLEIPEKLYKLINLMFPDQNFDQPFVQRFMKELPEMDVTKS